ncbi:unnamed protein product [Pleuronectes platessa]|uniref:Apolipoprotein L3 n=1 Tax=Pleuronectes platessa TaxID=8262 RepID=A0A9N7UQE6_PLEPL|nr:unnamed protein product [Pleuronectes platessa]
MTTADKLLEQMFSWIDQRSRCADQLVKVAEKLESLRQNCNGAECVGSSVAVGGAALAISAGVTILTGGAAAPILGLLGSIFLGAGTVISVGTKLVEHFLSGSTMKDAKEIEKTSDELANNIQQLFEKLKSEKKEANRVADLDDLDRHILTDILRALARRSGVNMKINFRMIGDKPNLSFVGGQHYTNLNFPIMDSVTGVLAFFTLSASGKKCNLLFAKGAQQLIKEISVTGLKTVLKGGGMLVGELLEWAFALNDAIDNWTDLIKTNNVTEASQSLRDTAKAIQNILQALRDRFEDMKFVYSGKKAAAGDRRSTHPNHFYNVTFTSQQFEQHFRRCAVTSGCLDSLDVSSDTEVLGRNVGAAARSQSNVALRQHLVAKLDTLEQQACDQSGDSSPAGHILDTSSLQMLKKMKKNAGAGEAKRSIENPERTSEEERELIRNVGGRRERPPSLIRSTWWSEERIAFYIVTWVMSLVLSFVADQSHCPSRCLSGRAAVADGVHVVVSTQMSY